MVQWLAETLLCFDKWTTTLHNSIRQDKTGIASSRVTTTTSAMAMTTMTMTTTTTSTTRQKNDASVATKKFRLCFIAQSEADKRLRC